QQLSTSEVAEVLGLSADNVKQRLSRAKAMLRAALEARTGSTLTELYPFEAPRCDRVVAGVLARLPNRHLAPPWHPPAPHHPPSRGRAGAPRFWYASAAGLERGQRRAVAPRRDTSKDIPAGEAARLGTGADSVKAYSAVLHKKPNDAEALAALEAMLKDDSVRAEAARALIPAYEAVKEH